MNENQNIPQQGINWEAFFGNAQQGADIFTQIFSTIKGPNYNGQPAPAATGGGLPSWMVWAIVALIIIIVLWMIYRK